MTGIVMTDFAHEKNRSHKSRAIREGGKLELELPEGECVPKRQLGNENRSASLGTRIESGDENKIWQRE
jgi:hypothetical protein